MHSNIETIELCTNKRVMLNRIISVDTQYLKLFNCASKMNCKRCLKLFNYVQIKLMMLDSNISNYLSGC